MPVQTQAEYRAWAEQAVKYTELALSMGRTNRSFGEVVEKTVETMGANILNQMAQRLRRNLLYTTYPIPQRIAAIAEAAKESNVGACIEFAAVAAMFLVENKVFPVEYMKLVRDGDAKHRIVVVGRPATGRQARSMPGEPEDWKSPAVICDAWEGTAYVPGEQEVACGPGGLVTVVRWESDSEVFAFTKD